MKTLVLLTVATFMVLSGAEAPRAALLRGDVTVEGDVIRLGDLFADAGNRRDMVVATAPAPGRRDVISAQELHAIARRAGLGWRPASRYDRVVVMRAARIVDTAEIRRKLRDALLAEGMPKNRRIALSKPDLVLHAALGDDRPVELTKPRYDARSGRFGALFLVPTGANGVERVRVTGEAYEVVAVPVLGQRVRRGAVIHARDLTTVTMKRDAIARDAILDPAEIVGLTPKRYLREGVPLRPADLQPPLLVHKGKLVTMTLRTDQMLITARARALDDGARGDVVRMLNPRSKNTVEGVVAGPGLVNVGMPTVPREAP